jgi:16S rRNA (adenine1518-N6/adenine1519-N6)-dimethyltransferase
MAKAARLGQNFLQDKNVIQKIGNYFNPKPDDVVLEIGAGLGALTRIVAPQVSRFIAVEIDGALIGELQQIQNIEVINKDFLEVDLASINPDKKIRVLGNLPYYISTAILTRLIRQKNWVEDMVLMFQEEVAQRILAPTSDSEYSLLSVMSQYYCEIDKGFRVSKNCFKPMPEIESRVMHFNFKPDVKIEVNDYVSFLQKAFSQRRKKLRNNLMRELDLESDRVDRIFKDMNIPENVRAENLTPQQFEELIGGLKSAAQNAD